MPSINVTLAVAAALTTLAAAVPHAHYKVHEQFHARDLELTPSVLEERAQSPNGQCGGSSGFTCAAGFCCSEWGFCGQSDAYCAAGCQSAFGTCNGSKPVSQSSTKAAATTSKAAASTPQALTTTKTTTTHPVVTHTVFSTMYVTTTVGGIATTLSSTVSSTKVSTVSSAIIAPTKVHTVNSKSSTSIKTSTSAPKPTSTLPSKATTFVPTTTFSTSTTSKSSSTSSTSTTSAAAAPTGGSGLGDQYTMYLGDGTTAQGWPAQSSWTNFESMWTNNLPLISISCTQFGQANNSPEESADIKSALQSVASDSGVDARFILAIMMQESKGCVRAPTTNYGVTNPGLMQSHDGAGSCNNGGVQNPCPQSEITQMITDGAEGTSSGDGLKQCLSESHATDVSEYYKAARIYNSGSIAASGNLQDGIATHCYSSDIANRLTGWVNAATKCTLG